MLFLWSFGIKSKMCFLQRLSHWWYQICLLPTIAITVDLVKFAIV